MKAADGIFQYGGIEGREYRHVAADLNPKMNSPIMYNREAVDHWIERQRPAIRRRITK
ncbi:hypothetical protein SOD10_39370 [Serratia plymuthica]|uniref:Uncharacterized protein n=1 Tax=Serratia plymuthica S13 TaxID=1348660 RepID=S4YNK6_SERPL|nr:hypothetical protein M621_05805 [Serratia plymuthica S13]KYG14962.1 hypothetical protein SOD10_39370 [Serratia plymuthica]QQT82716.1 excisionase family protein [Serratia plymuthica]